MRDRPWNRARAPRSPAPIPGLPRGTASPYAALVHRQHSETRAGPRRGAPALKPRARGGGGARPRRARRVARSPRGSLPRTPVGVASSREARRRRGSISPERLPQPAGHRISDFFPPPPSFLAPFILVSQKPRLLLALPLRARGASFATSLAAPSSASRSSPSSGPAPRPASMSRDSLRAIPPRADRSRRRTRLAAIRLRRGRLTKQTYINAKTAKEQSDAVYAATQAEAEKAERLAIQAAREFEASVGEDEDAADAATDGIQNLEDEALAEDATLTAETETYTSARAAYQESTDAIVASRRRSRRRRRRRRRRRARTTKRRRSRRSRRRRRTSRTSPRRRRTRRRRTSRPSARKPPRRRSRARSPSRTPRRTRRRRRLRRRTRWRTRRTRSTRSTPRSSP